MTTSPISGSGPKLPTSPLPTAHGGGAPAAAAKAAAHLPVDRNLAGTVRHVLHETAVNLDAIKVPLDKLDDTSNVLSTAMEADRMRSHDASLGKVGMAMAAVNIFLDAKTLVKSLGEQPIPLDRVIGSLVGIGVNMGEFVEKGFLAGLSGVSNAIQGYMGAVDAVKRAKQEGANPSNVLEALSYATQALGGVAQTLALACPPLAPALEPISIGLYMASGALTLAQFAYDHREWIQDKATQLWGAIQAAGLPDKPTYHPEEVAAVSQVLMTKASQQVSEGVARLEAIAAEGP
jgi:hypothetical protein